MTQRYSAASIYANLDRMDAGSLREWLDWHKALKHPPRYVNLFAAAKMNESVQVLREVKAALPKTTPVWRAYDGRDAWGGQASAAWTDGNWWQQCSLRGLSETLAAERWFARRVQPHLNVIRETGAIVMLLNEADPVFNARFEAECIRLLGEEGIRAAAMCWATGNPANWGDYAHPAIEAEIRAAGKYNALLRCHEYAGFKPEEQNSLIGRFEHILKAYENYKQPTPDMLIGEFGLCKATIQRDAAGANMILLDPDVGWRMMPGIGEVQYLDYTHAAAQTYYVPRKASISIFDWHGWGTNDSFGVRGAATYLNALRALCDSHLNFAVEDDVTSNPTPPVVVNSRPDNLSIPIKARLVRFGASGKTRNLRDTWSYTGADVGDVNAGDIVVRYEIPIKTGPVSANQTGKWQFVEVMSGDTVTAQGWLWADGAVWEAVIAEPPPVVVPDPPTPPQEPNPHKLYEIRVQTRMTVTEAEHLSKGLLLGMVALAELGVWLDDTNSPHHLENAAKLVRDSLRAFSYLVAAPMEAKLIPVEESAKVDAAAS